MGVNYSGAYATARLDLGVAWMEYLAEGIFPEFCGLEILPTFRTPKQAANFSALTRDTMLSAAAALRAPKAGYNRVDVGAKDKSYSCTEYGLEGVIDDRERALYQSDFDHENAVLMHVGRKVRLAQEIRIKNLVFNTGTFTAGAGTFIDQSATPWATPSSDILKLVKDAKEQHRKNTGMEANALIIGRAVFEALLLNEGIKARFPGNAGPITRAMIEAALLPLFGLTKLIVGNGVQNTADEGQTAALSDIWSDTYAMVARVADQGAPLTTPCLGRTFLWTPDSAEDLVVETYREEQVRGDVLRARHDVGETIIDSAFGVLLQVK